MSKNTAAALKKYNDIIERYTRLEENLNKCDSFDKLSQILSKYQELKRRGFFATPSNLNDNKCRILSSRKLSITSLISELNEKFPAPVVVKEELQLGLVQEKVTQEEVEMIQDEAQQAKTTVLQQGSSSHSYIESVPDISEIPVPKVEPRGPRLTIDLSGALQTVLVSPGKHEADCARRLEQMRLVNEKLGVLLAKNQEFNQQKYSDKIDYLQASNAIQAIHISMTSLVNQYVANGDLDAFKAASKTLLSEENSAEVKVLQGHRGVKELLINLAVFIGTLGTVHAAASIYSSIKNKELTFFKVKIETDSAKVINDLDETVQAVIASPAA